MAINWSNVTDLGDLPQQANIATGGGFWVNMLYMCWVVLLLIFSKFGFEAGMLLSSFLCLILSLLLVYAGLIAWVWCLTFVGIILAMFLYIIFNNRKTS